MLSEDEFKSRLGLLIRKLRQNKKLASDKLGWFCGVDYSTINLIENGKKNPRAWTLYKIFMELDINIDSFLLDQKKDYVTQKAELIERINQLDPETIEALAFILNNLEIKKKKQ